MQVGQDVSCVVQVIVVDRAASPPRALVQSMDKWHARCWLVGDIPEATQLVGVGLRVESRNPLQLAVIPQSYVYPLHACQKQEMYQVTEVCSGIGSFSSTWGKLGFRVALGVDMNGAWRDLFQKLHAGSQSMFLEAEAGSKQTVQTMLSNGLVHGVLLSGVACQPYSRLGDGKGMADERANSLPQTLMTAWLTQSTVVILECVEPVLEHADFQQVLRQFCEETGYQLFQKVVHLSNHWCSKRTRWFGVLTAPGMPKMWVE